MLDIVVTLTGSACKDEISLLVSLFDCVPDGISTMACVVEVKVGSASQSADGHFTKTTLSAEVVTPVLGESFLEESTPEGAIITSLGHNEAISAHRELVINDD